MFGYQLTGGIDTFRFLCIVGLGMAFVNRTIIKPKRLPLTRDAMYTILFIFGLNLGGGRRITERYMTGNALSSSTTGATKKAEASDARTKRSAELRIFMVAAMKIGN